jgi:CDP-paratose synthetase
MHIKHILITGGTGYLGSNLIKFLVQKEIKISVLIRDNSNLSRINELNTNINLININKLEEALIDKKIDGIIHTATCYGRNGEFAEEVINANLIFPISLIRLAIKHKLNFFINTHTSLPKNLNYYSLSKFQFKEWLKFYSDKIKLLNIIPEYIFGPNDDETKFVTYVITKLVSNSKSIDFSSGVQLRDFIYIDDAVSAYYTILVNLEDINTNTDIPLGSARTISLNNLVNLIITKTNKSATQLNFGKLPDRKGDVMESIADVSILKSLNWEPQYTLEEGIQKTIDLQNITR